MDELEKKLTLFISLNWNMGQILDIEDIEEFGDSYSAFLTWKHGRNQVQCERVRVSKISFGKWLVIQELRAEVEK